MTAPGLLASSHNLYRDALFQAKSSLHALMRAVRDVVISPVRRGRIGSSMTEAPLLSGSESALWYSDDNEKNWILTAGKIQNLRVAARKLNGLEIPAGMVFSFWRHVGMPSRSRGYVVGREIREGCLVPTIAGGLCQLSNALYDAALKAGFTIVERHRHSRVVPGSLAEVDRDATVKWNYVDLRFLSDRPFRIEVGITHDKLLLRLLGQRPVDAGTVKASVLRSASRLNDCYSCGNIGCHRHQGDKVEPRATGTTAYLLDERWPEYEEHINSSAGPEDLFLLPFKPGRPIGTARYGWHPTTVRTVKDVPLSSLRRAVALRMNKGGNGSLPPLLMRYDEVIAASMLRSIPVECTHVVIAQNLLPFVWREGALGGRTFDVLMTRLPMERLHARLDFAHTLHQASRTISDYRAPSHLVDLESMALTKAHRIITPHAEIAAVFNNKSTLLQWQMPPARSHVPGTKVLFPASALARKGAYEMRNVARAMDLQLVVLGRDMEEDHFWKGLKVDRAGVDPFEGVGAVVLPAFVEHQPRILLRAIAAGIPVITTTASGLRAREDVTLIPMGDVDALAQAVGSISKGWT